MIANFIVFFYSIAIFCLYYIWVGAKYFCVSPECMGWV